MTNKIYAKDLALILASSLMLSGCMYQSVDQYDLSRAIKVCGSVENIFRIKSHFLGFENVRCFDTKGGNVNLAEGIRK